MTLLLTILFTAWIWMALRRGDMPWYTVSLPLIFIGLLATLLQPEEEWQYTPWQDATQKYEKNIYD
jgi:cbb3-type cytochrome oxidase subunit 3